MYLIFDTETTGLPKDFTKPISDFDNWSFARCVQIGWQLHDKYGKLIDVGNDIIKPDDFDIPQVAVKIHGITNEKANKCGISIKDSLEKFTSALEQAVFLIGHNVEFDINVIGSEYYRIQNNSPLTDFKIIDTMKTTVDYCELRVGQEGVIKEVVSDGKWKTKEGDFMYKFKISFENNDVGMLYKKSDTMPNLEIGDVVSYDINNKGTIKVRKGFKPPKLEELYEKLFKEKILNAHNAAADVDATARCFFELLRQNFFSPSNADITQEDINDFIDKNKTQIKLLNIDINVEDKLNGDNSEEPTNKVFYKKEDANSKNNQETIINNQIASEFCHTRCHTSYSILQSTISIKKLINQVIASGMKSVAITDYGNLFGAFEFISLCQKHNILPILGCEFYLVKDRKIRQGGFTRDNKDTRYSQVLYAKNENGYRNLCKISSYGYIDGLYNGFPRVDKSLIQEYKVDLIATTSGIYGEIAQLFLNIGVTKAKECFLWWLNEFRDDFYIELSRNDVEDEEELNKLLLSWAKEYNVKCLPANRIYYLDKSDATAHDALLCVKNGAQMSTPKGKGHGFRLGLPNNNFYFKSTEEMTSLFSDLPQVFEDVKDFVLKFKLYNLTRDVLLPQYDLPDDFNTQNEYLRYLCDKGAEKKYNNVSSEISKRINFELETIEKTGYPGYFLIIQDIIKQAKKMGVSVGPGRGSVGGSVVAYCLDITTIDPMKYDLLFERFLNPDRISMPDIDIDFDDIGRSKLISWVVEKYGETQVAQIITYGRMAAKSSIRDMGRVLDIPLSKVDVLAKTIPNISLSDIFSLTNKELSSKLNRNDVYKVKQLLASLNTNKDESEIINLARLIEGSIRNLGTHACGLIITPDDIVNYIPVCKSSDSNLLITQFDNNVVEKAGMLKMDFLGLKTLSIIKDAVLLVEKRHNIKLDIENVDLEDTKTFSLYQSGETNATFQFESDGMQKHLRSLKPDKFEDLIAMNALYRPGPLEYIPNFIERKHGREKINYDLPEMEKILGATYGITVYQEQVMLLSQELAGFSKGDADKLRKAMGKKDKKLLDGLKEDFLKGCAKQSYNIKKVEKIWKDWESFAAYAFNKSHSTCYSYVAFQTGYLKAHYPEEYMASVLTHNMNDLSKLTYYMDECRRININVLGPDLNESFINYSVNQNDDIRFGLGAIKGVGSVAAESMIHERDTNGKYSDFMDFIKRIDSRVVNKRVLESLTLGGAFDGLTNLNRANFFKETNNQTFIEEVIQFRTQFSKNNESNTQLEMFDKKTMTTMTQEPVLTNTEEWGRLELLNKEKDVLGIYISGHPLDDYSLEVKQFCSHQIKDIDMFNAPITNFTFSGYLHSHTEKMSKNDKPYGVFILEDYSGAREFRLFSDNYIKFRNYFIVGSLLYFSASMAKRTWDNTLGLRINEIMPLSDVSEKLINEINFKIELSNIDEIFVDNIIRIVKKYPGKHNLKLSIYDQNIHLNFLSKKYQVKICENFINDISINISKKYILK